MRIGSKKELAFEYDSDFATWHLSTRENPLYSLHLSLWRSQELTLTCFFTPRDFEPIESANDTITRKSGACLLNQLSTGSFLTQSSMSAFPILAWVSILKACQNLYGSLKKVHGSATREFVAFFPEVLVLWYHFLCGPKISYLSSRRTNAHSLTKTHTGDFLKYLFSFVSEINWFAIDFLDMTWFSDRELEKMENHS